MKIIDKRAIYWFPSERSYLSVGTNIFYIKDRRYHLFHGFLGTHYPSGIRRSDIVVV